MFWDDPAGNGTHADGMTAEVNNSTIITQFTAGSIVDIATNQFEKLTLDGKTVLGTARIFR